MSINPIIPFRRTRVLVRDAWFTGAWAVEKTLIAERVEERERSWIIRLRRDMGTTLELDSDEFADLPEIALVGKFVMVELLADDADPENTGAEVLERWVGVVVAGDRSPHAPPIEDDPLEPYAQHVEQGWIVVGLDSLLDRRVVRGMRCVGAINYDGETAKAEPTSAITTPSTVFARCVFNEGRGLGLKVRGNRTHSAVKIQGNFITHLFAGRPAKTGVWTVMQIVDYLMLFHSPPDVAMLTLPNDPPETGSPPEPGIRATLAGIEVASFNAEGMTVGQCFDALLGPSAGLGWRIVTTAEGTFPNYAVVARLHVFSRASTQQIVGDAILPKAKAIEAVDVADELTVVSTQIAHDERDRFGSITILGNPILSCFTISNADENLVKAWTDAQQTAFVDADGPDHVLMALRSRSPVFQRFMLDPDWDWRAGNGEGGEERVPATFPISSAGNIMTSITVGEDTIANPRAPQRHWGIAWSPFLPIEAEAGPVADEETEEAEEQYQAPFGVVDRTNGTVEKQFIYLHQGSMGMPGVGLGLSSGYIEMRGPGPESLARDIMTGTQRFASGNIPTHDWRKIMLTVAVRIDQRVGVSATIDATNPRELVIELPAELWVIAKGTILKIKEDGEEDAGTLVRETASPRRIVRDDRAILRRVLAGALGWMGQLRRTVTLTVGRASVRLPVGTLISTVDDGVAVVQVQTTVVSRTIDFVNNITTWQTGSTMPDFRGWY